MATATSFAVLEENTKVFSRQPLSHKKTQCTAAGLLKALSPQQMSLLSRHLLQSPHRRGRLQSSSQTQPNKLPSY